MAGHDGGQARAADLLHDLTLTTHSEHVHYMTKWHIGHTQLLRL